MSLVKFPALIVHQSSEHCAVFHVVSVNNHVVAGFKGAAMLRNIRHPICAVFLFKAALQVEVGTVRRKHHRVVDVCAVNGNPPCHIVVLVEKLLIFGKRGLVFSLCWLLRRFFGFPGFFRFLCLLHNLRQLCKFIG